MITFITGLMILFIGSFFYSKYVVKQFEPQNTLPPSFSSYDGIDYIPMPTSKNMLVHLLNIAGMGPILGAIQGILFGPIAFILIPLGAVLFGGVYDYFAGMISVKNNGEQVVTIVKRYLGTKVGTAYIFLVSTLLILLTAVFIYTSGDIIAERFFAQHDFSLSNPIILTIYICILGYFLVATLFPIDKIIGKLYPLLTILLIFGTLLIFIGFFINGIELKELCLQQINLHPESFPLFPMFFMTVSCGLLSGFHATQATIISRTLKSEFDGKKVFYAMMILESLIAMIWAAGAMSVYSNNLVPQNLIGTANVVNIIADNFVPLNLAFLITIAVVILPITSGDTALRGFRMIIAEQFNLSQKPIKNRFIIAIPTLLLLLFILYWAKVKADSFGVVWRYFNFSNQLISIPVFLSATVYLFNKSKNYFITLIPALFYIFITATFILNSKIGLNINMPVSKTIASLTVLVITAIFYKSLNKKQK